MKWIKSRTDLNTHYCITDDDEIVGIVSREAKAVYRASVKGIPTYRTFKSKIRAVNYVEEMLTSHT